MLQTIRDNAQGFIAKAIIAFIAVGFVFFGVDFLGVGKTPPRAEVNGEPIGQEAFRQALQQQKNLLRARLGDQFDAAQLDDERLALPVLEGLIAERLLDQATARYRTGAARPLVDGLILQESAFHDEAGHFSEDRYRQLLFRAGLTPLAYRDSLASDIRRQHLLSAFMAASLETDTGFRQTLRLLRQTRDVRYILLPREPFESAVSLTDEAVADYYARHPQDFRSDEQVAVEYLLMRRADFYPVIDEARIRARYEAELADYRPGVERRAAHILLETGAGLSEAEASLRLQDLLARIAVGESFESLAASHSQDTGSARQGGDLGYSRGDSFPPAFEAALAALEPGEVSQPVVTEAGVHLIRLLEVRDLPQPSLDESRARIELALKREAAEAVFGLKIEELADATYTAPDLTAAAEALGLPVQQVPLFARHAAPAPLRHPAALAAAFHPDLIRSGANSQLLELDEQSVLVLRVTAHQPAAVRPLEEVRATVEERLRAEQATVALMAEAEAIRQQLAAGADIESVADAHGQAWQVALAADRFAGQLPADLLERAFALPAPPAGMRVLEVMLRGDGQAVILEVSRVTDADASRLTAMERDSLRRFLVMDQGQWLQSLWQDRLRSTAKIRHY